MPAAHPRAGGEVTGVVPAIAVLAWTFGAGALVGAWLRNRAFAKHPPHSHLTCPIGARLLTVVEEIEYGHRLAGPEVSAMACLRFGAKGRIYLARITRANEPAKLDEPAHG